MKMKTETPEYLLLFRGNEWDKELSPEEIQTIMTRWNAWFEGLVEKGTAKAGQPLANAGKIVSGKKGRMVVDGPFAESKEAVAGYFLLAVGSENEAVEIARQCPALDHGMTVEVRRVVECCAENRRPEVPTATASA